MYVIVNHYMRSALDDGTAEFVVRAVYGPYLTREDAEESNVVWWPTPELNRIVPLYDPPVSDR